jgi:hypothetical protein
VNAKPLLFFAVIAALLWSWAVEAAPIRVRLMEGNFRGLLVLRSLDGTAIAYAEVCQKAMGDLVECRTILRFTDGSLYDESATFSQKGVFRLEAYRLVQHGPSYPTLEVSIAGAGNTRPEVRRRRTTNKRWPAERSNAG